MGQEGSRGDKDHRTVHEEEDNPQQGHELLEVNGNVRGHRRSIHGEVGFCRGSHLGGGCIHGMMGHGGHSHPGTVGELESGIEHGHGECPVEST